PNGTPDTAIDYKGCDVVITRTATDLPVDFALGAEQYEEAYHLGYPDEDLGGTAFGHRWGPQASALRSWPFGRFLDGWAEADLHYAPYDSPQLIMFLDVGFGL